VSDTLREVALAADPALQEYAVARPAGGRYGDSERGFVLEAVAELADLISACAQAQAENRPEHAERRWAEAADKLAPTG